MSKKAIFRSLTRQMLFLIPGLLILPSLLGTSGVWVSMPISDFMAFMVTFILLRKQFRLMRSEDLGVSN